MQSKAHPVAYFTRQNPFSRFTGATGARACKSNARCPLVNLRINTHRVEIIYAAGASTSPFPFSVPSSAFPFLFLSLSSLFFFFSFHPLLHEASRFSDVESALSLCPGRLREAFLVKRDPRYIRSLVDRYVSWTLIRR